MITCWVAYSGGRDSHVLLHTLASCRESWQGVQLKAIHVNHQIHPQSNQWALHCEKTAQALNIPFESHALDLNLQPGDSLEAVAREARYALFARLLSPSSILMTAHNQDDQAETFLLQALRGAGPKGLNSIAPERALGKGLLVRPLLGVSRDEINAYAAHHQLVFIEDPSNQNRQFRRNFLRHEIMPMLKSVYPAASACLARSSVLCAQDSELLTQYIQENFESAFDRNKPLTLSCETIKALAPKKQYQLLRYWFSENKMRPPSLKQCEMIINEIVYAKIDAKPRLKIAHWLIKRIKGELIVSLYSPNDIPKRIRMGSGME